MILDRIIEGCNVLNSRGYLNVDIHSVCNDSRKVAEGSLFVAVKEMI